MRHQQGHKSDYKMLLNPFSFSGWLVFISSFFILCFFIFGNKFIQNFELFKYQGLNFLWYLSLSVFGYFLLNLFHFIPLFFFNKNPKMSFNQNSKTLEIPFKFSILFWWLSPVLEISLNSPQQKINLQKQASKSEKLIFLLPKLPHRNWQIAIQKLTWQDPLKFISFIQILPYHFNYNNLEIQQKYTTKKLQIQILKQNVSKSALQKNEEEFDKLQAYQNHSLKYINWKISAKKNQTIVKQPDKIEEEKEFKNRFKKEKIYIFIDNSACILNPKYQDQLAFQEFFWQVLVKQMYLAQAILDLTKNPQKEIYLSFFNAQKVVESIKINNQNNVEMLKIYSQIQLYSAADFLDLQNSFNSFSQKMEGLILTVTAKPNSFFATNSFTIYLNPQAFYGSFNLHYFDLRQINENNFNYYLTDNYVVLDILENQKWTSILSQKTIQKYV